MPFVVLSVLVGVVLMATAALMLNVVRRAGAAREELSDRASSHGWRYVRSLESSKGDFHIEGATRGTAEWTITSWSVNSDSRHSRVEFRLPAAGSTHNNFAIGSAKQLAGLPQFAAFTEQHPRAASLIAKVGSRAGVGGLLAIVSDGVAEPLGSREFQQTFGAIRTHDSAMPVRMTPELEALFLRWPPGITDPGSAVSAWRDAEGLHVQVISIAGPPFEVIEHLAALGEALGASVT